MCDSFVALGNSTESGSVLLAKSADTEVNEAEQVVRYPRRHYGDGALARITHRTIPQAPLTHQVILGRSFWAWGAELACNEHGGRGRQRGRLQQPEARRRRHVLPRSVPAERRTRGDRPRSGAGGRRRRHAVRARAATAR